MSETSIAQKVQPYLLVPSKSSNKAQVERTQVALDTLQGKINQIDARLRDKKAFLPIETGPEKLRQLLRGLEEEKSTIEKRHVLEKAELARHNKHIAMARAGFRNQLDLTFLSLTKTFPAKGIFGLGRAPIWPTFAVINVQNENKTFRLEAQASSSPYRYSSYATGLPKVMGLQYSKTIDRLVAISKRKDYSEVTITVRYNGIMPDKTREKIVDAVDKKLFDQVYIIVEAPDWELDVKVPVPEADPIVIGWCSDTEQAFVIDIYDPTPLEQYVHDQFGFGITLPEEK